MVPDNVTWAQVAFLLIVSAPGIIAAYFGAKNARSLKTPNGRAVGQMVAESHATTEKAEAGNLPEQTGATLPPPVLPAEG